MIRTFISHDNTSLLSRSCSSPHLQKGNCSRLSAAKRNSLARRVTIITRFLNFKATKSPSYLDTTTQGGPICFPCSQGCLLAPESFLSNPKHVCEIPGNNDGRVTSTCHTATRRQMFIASICISSIAVWSCHLRFHAIAFVSA